MLRPAEASDFPAIRDLIRRVRINPLALDWRRFVIAVDENDQMIGCGQIKPHDDGAYELASIAVEPAWRGRGVARAIIEHLLAAHPGVLYLTCRSELESFYRPFGFRPIEAAEMPPYFRRIYRLARWIVRLRFERGSMLVMKRG